MLGLSLLTFLIAVALNSLNTMTGASCIDRPIFIGGFLGLILGDLTTGILIGAMLELIFLGVGTIGPGGQAADILGSAVICTTIGITQNIPIGAMIPFGIIIGYAGVAPSTFRLKLSEFTNKYTDKAFVEGNQRKYTFLAVSMHFVASAARYFWIIPVTMFGGNLVSAIIKRTPEVIIQGLTVAGTILPTFGFAVILTYFWNAKLAIFFFVGFTIFNYFNLDMAALFVLALCIGITDLLLKLEFGKNRAAAPGDGSSLTSEEEDFLS